MVSSVARTSALTNGIKHYSHFVLFVNSTHADYTSYIACNNGTSNNREKKMSDDHDEKV